MMSICIFRNIPPMETNIQPRGMLLNFMFGDRASLYNRFQMKPSRFTLLISIFISTSLHVSGDGVTIIKRTYCVYVTLVFFTVYGWLSGLQTRQPATHTQCHIDKVVSPDYGHTVARNM